MSDCVSVCFKKISAIAHEMFEAICKTHLPWRYGTEKNMQLAFKKLYHKLWKEGRCFLYIFHLFNKNYTSKY